MILFLKDWKKYPTAIIDYNTTNKHSIYQKSKYKECSNC